MDSVWRRPRALDHKFPNLSTFTGDNGVHEIDEVPFISAPELCNQATVDKDHSPSHIS
jgi:hypothetical protein